MPTLEDQDGRIHFQMVCGKGCRLLRIDIREVFGLIWYQPLMTYRRPENTVSVQPGFQPQLQLLLKKHFPGCCLGNPPFLEVLGCFFTGRKELRGI